VRLLGDETSEAPVDLESRQGDADEAPHDVAGRAHFDIGDGGVTGVAAVNEEPDGESVVAPTTRFSLGEAVEAPGLYLLWDLVGEAATALHEPFDDVFVRQHDIQVSGWQYSPLRDRAWTVRLTPQYRCGSSVDSRI